MRNADLNSMLLASTEPERLHRWYADGLDPDEDAEVDRYRVLRFGRFSVMIDGRADVAEAERFYGDVLGPRVVEEAMGLLTLHLADGREILVYPKDDHVPASYTILNFPVPDIERTVDALAARGVTFERYDGFDQDERGISRGEPLVAWFTDPAGNILSVLQT